MQCRCLGDHDLKGPGGLTAEPEVTSRDLDDKDAFLIAASDGLWDCISNAEAVNIVHDTGTATLAEYTFAPSIPFQSLLLGHFHTVAGKNDFKQLL